MPLLNFFLKSNTLFFIKKLYIDGHFIIKKKKTKTDGK